MLTLILIGFAMSIDSFGIGISYGIRKIRIALSSMIIISFISLIICAVSAFLGSLLPIIFTETISVIIGGLMLLSIGIFIIFQGFGDTNEPMNTDKNLSSLQKKEAKTIFTLFIKAFGITINIIKCPETGDINNSNIIEPKEALYLGCAMSIDSVGAAVGGGALGINPFLFPFMICIFQIVFLVLGALIGKKIKLKPSKKYLPTLLSGLVLILIALWQLFDLFL